MEVVEDLGSLPVDPPKKRPICSTCRRPAITCWCQYLRPAVEVSTTVYILQHPYEETRRLKTAPMILHGLPKGRCKILKGKRFALHRYPELKKLAEDPNTLLLYPGQEAVDIVESRSTNVKVNSKVTGNNLLVIDGTWPQAKGIYRHNTWLHNIKQVKICSTSISEYVIRTQPTDACLSTVETVAKAISILENRPDIEEGLVQPLKALCDFQIQHGAVKHHSRQYQIDHGLYDKPTGSKDVNR